MLIPRRSFVEIVKLIYEHASNINREQRRRISDGYYDSVEEQTPVEINHKSKGRVVKYHMYYLKLSLLCLATHAALAVDLISIPIERS